MQQNCPLSAPPDSVIPRLSSGTADTTVSWIRVDQWSRFGFGGRATGGDLLCCVIVLDMICINQVYYVSFDTDEITPRILTFPWDHLGRRTPMTNTEITGVHWEISHASCIDICTVGKAYLSMLLRNALYIRLRRQYAYFDVKFLPSALFSKHYGLFCVIAHAWSVNATNWSDIVVKWQVLCKPGNTCGFKNPKWHLFDLTLKFIILKPKSDRNVLYSIIWIYLHLMSLDLHNL